MSKLNMILSDANGDPIPGIAPLPVDGVHHETRLDNLCAESRAGIEMRVLHDMLWWQEQCYRLQYRALEDQLSAASNDALHEEIVERMAMMEEQRNSAIHVIEAMFRQPDQQP